MVRGHWSKIADRRTWAAAGAAVAMAATMTGFGAARASAQNDTAETPDAPPAKLTPSLDDLLSFGGLIDKAKQIDTKTLEENEGPCDAGDIEACQKVAHVRRYSLDTKMHDAKEARELYSLGCSEKIAKSCLEYGRMAAQGLGGDVAAEGAVAAFRFACDEGLGKACINIGVQQKAGEGIEKDLPAARDAFRIYCDKGELIACHNYAIMLGNGEGGEKSMEAAKALMALTCEAGNRGSCMPPRPVRVGPDLPSDHIPLKPRD